MQLINMTVFAILLTASGQIAHSQTTAISDASQYGWLEGTITNNQGQAISNNAFSDGKHLKGVRQGGGEFDTQTDTRLGGLYSLKNIRSGIYDITIEKGYIASTPFCPERIFGVVVKPGQRTVLNIIMDQGETYEEVGKPEVVTNPATNVTMELAQMQKQIDDLKQQVAALQKPVSPTPPAAPAKP